MSIMVLDEVEASSLSALGGSDECVFDILHVLLRHLLGHGVLV
jgi:hypothetical protein